jgi:hypothetical protein
LVVLLLDHLEIVVDEGICFIFFLFQKHKQSIFGIFLPLGTDGRLAMTHLFDLLHKSIVDLLCFLELLVVLVDFDELLLIGFAFVDEFADRGQPKQIVFG